jgi:hypothetical protein
VTFACSDSLTRGKIVPFKNAELVTTKYAATMSTTKTTTIPINTRSQIRRLRGAGETNFDSFIKALSTTPF